VVGCKVKKDSKLKQFLPSTDPGHFYALKAKRVLSHLTSPKIEEFHIMIPMGCEKNTSLEH